MTARHPARSSAAGSGRAGPPQVVVTVDVEHPDRPSADGSIGELTGLARARGVPLTLFVEGRWAAAHPDDLGDALAAADPATTVGLHSYSHVDLRRLTAAGVRQEIADNRAALAPVVEPIPVLRLPYGLGGDHDHVRAGVAAEGVRILGWDVSARDWDHDTSDRSALARLLPALDRGGVVLLHSWPSRTPWLLAELLDRGLAAGTRFCAIDPPTPTVAALPLPEGT